MFNLFLYVLSDCDSDKFFKTCLTIIQDDSEHRRVWTEEEDNLTANEYYVILDKPYQYYEHDDLDAFVASAKARLLSQFKEDAMSLENEQFECKRKSNFIRFIQMYDEDTCKVKLAVTISQDFTVSIQVHDEIVSTSHEIWADIPTTCYSLCALEKVLNTVNLYSVCDLNRDTELQELVPVEALLDSKDSPK